MRKILTIIAAALMAAACSQTEKSEETVAEIEAAQMEGRTAARVFIGREWNDTTQLQHNLLEARSHQSKYVINNKPHCAAAFDSAFISTVRTVKPDLARQIKP